MLRMLRKDRVLLRNVTIAVVAGSLGALAIGTTCLGRRPTRSETTVSSTTPTTSDESAQSSAGGVPTPARADPVSTTNITSTTIAEPAASVETMETPSSGTVPSARPPR